MFLEIFGELYARLFSTWLRYLNVVTTGGLFYGNIPPYRVPIPQIEIWYAINQWSNYKIFNVNPPCTSENPPIETFLATVLRHLPARLVSVTEKQERQTSGVTSKTVKKRLLVFAFANFSTVNAHYTQIGKVDLYVDTTMDNLLDLEHHTGYTKLNR